MNKQIRYFISKDVNREIWRNWQKKGFQIVLSLSLKIIYYNYEIKQNIIETQNVEL